MDNDKKKSKCPNCGASIEENTKFCPSCGKKLTETAAIPVVKEEHTITCPECGTVLEPGTLFCPNCGSKTTTEEKPTVKEEPVEEEAVYCPSCGKKVSKDDVFCPHCSARIKGSSSQSDDQPISNNMTHCPHCGSLVEKGTKFCPYCSKQISGKKEFVISYTAIKIIKATVLAALGLVLCFVLYKVVLQKPLTYNRAIKLKEQEQYEEAYDIFRTLGDYKDSSDQCDECMARIENSIYLDALQLYNEGKYEAALEKFSKIRGYADADSYIEQIEDTIVGFVEQEIFFNTDVFQINACSLWSIFDSTGKKDGKGHISNIMLYIVNEFCDITINADADYTYSSEEETINDFVITRINYQSIDVKLTGYLPEEKKNDMYIAIQQQCFPDSNINANRFLYQYEEYSEQNVFTASYALSVSKKGQLLNDIVICNTQMRYDPLTGNWNLVNHYLYDDKIEIRNIHDVQIFIRSIPNKSGEKLGILDVDDYLYVTQVLEDASAQYGDSEYRWYRVFTTDGTEAWVAERKSQVWYRFY